MFWPSYYNWGNVQFLELKQNVVSDLFKLLLFAFLRFFSSNYNFLLILFLYQDIQRVRNPTSGSYGLVIWCLLEKKKCGFITENSTGMNFWKRRYNFCSSDHFIHSFSLMSKSRKLQIETRKLLGPNLHGKLNLSPLSPCALKFDLNWPEPFHILHYFNYFIFRNLYEISKYLLRTHLSCI